MISLVTNAATILILCLLSFFAAYFLYARYLSRHIFQIDPSETTPAHEFRDGVDYVPSHKHVLFGHHFCSITGAAPIVGPAVAVIWGWLPAVIWVVLGTIFIGAVHDFGTLVLSARREGRSISDICGDIVGERSRLMFLLLVAVLIWVVLAVFAVIISILFVQYPESVVPVHFELVVAVAIGFLVYRLDTDLTIPSLVALIALYGIIVLTLQVPALEQFRIYQLVPFGPGDMDWMGVLGFESAFQREVFTWVLILLLYSFIASTIPVWILLQPRDYINSHLLFVGMGAIYIGMFMAAPQIKAPPLNSDVKNPGALAQIRVHDDENIPGHLPEGLIIVPSTSSADFESREMTREDLQKTRPRFYLVSGVSGEELEGNAMVPIRALTPGEGEDTAASMVPVLSPDGSPFLFREGNIQPRDATGSSRSNGTPSPRVDLAGAISLQPDVPTESAPPLLPFLFITIACGAISGFHGLVSSGTTAKQLDSMKDCQYIGYGGMVGEGLLGLTSVMACTAGFSLLAERKGVQALDLWQSHYSSWGGADDFGAKMGAFVEGGAEFLAVLPRVPHDFSVALVAIIVISFAATTLDSAARIQRYIIKELSEVFDATDFTGGRYGRGAIAAFTPILLVFGSAWMALWPMFGATNQMLAGLSMLVVTVYLIKNRKQAVHYLVPMVFLILVTGSALVLNTIYFFEDGFLGGTVEYQSILLTVLSLGLFLISLWIVAEGVYQVKKGGSKEK